jgi:hypothetical protein
MVSGNEFSALNDGLWPIYAVPHWTQAMSLAETGADPK